MSKTRYIISLILALLLATVPTCAMATETDIESNHPITFFELNNESDLPEEYSLTLECLVEGKVPADAEFVFGVSEAELIMSDIDDIAVPGTETAIADFVVKTKDSADGKAAYPFPEKIKQGGVFYNIKLKSCNIKGAVIPTLEVHVYFFHGGSVKTEIFKNGELYDDESFDAFAFGQTVKVDCTKAAEIKVTTEGCEALTKVYDGKLTAAVTDKNYKLLGVAEGHEVTLTFEKAEYNSADVKKASKITVSGLKLGGKDADKYALVTDKFEVKGNVTPRPLTVTADKLVMTLGQDEPKLTYTLSEELIDGNKVIGSLARESGNGVGTYAVTRGTLSFGDNYTVTFQDGTLTISNFSYAEVKDPATSIKISGHFDSTATIKVTALDPQSEVYTALANGTSWGKIVSSYDIVFTNNGFDGDLTVAIPVDGKYEGKEFAVYQQMANGSIACYKTVATGGIVSVETDECSQFMLVTEKDKAPKEESSAAMTVLKVIIIILAVIIGLALLIALFFFGMIFFNKTEQLRKIIKAIKRLFKK